MRTSQLVLRGALVAALLPFTTAASCDGGYRADSGDCPDGEVCSPETPTGLHFRGVIIGEGFFDAGNVKTTALGGTQDVQVETETDDGERAPFLLPHDVDADNANFTVEAASGDSFTLRSHAEGDAQIRVVDPSTGELFDRVRAAALPLASITTQMTLNVAIETGFNNHTLNKLYAPGATGYIRMASADDTSLVDTSSQISGARITQAGWDTFVVGDLAVGPHTLSVTAGASSTFTVPFEVAIPDQITGGPSSLTQGKTTLACFVARKGSVPIHARFDAITSSEASIQPSAYDGCVNVVASTVGAVNIHVISSGLTADFVLTSHAPASARTQVEDEAPLIGTPGDRASMASE
ncbi:hypothetical protein BH11MYX2_BH11MYX2_23090 [soil metagenome]